MLRDKLSLALIAGIVMAICGIMVFSEAAMVKAVGDQTTIHIVDKTGDSTISTITFPEGEPSTTVSAPYSDVDSGDPQVVAGSGSEPVVRLKNTSAGTLKVWLQITSWTDAVVAEDYALVDTTTTDVSAVNVQLSANGLAASVDTGVSMGAGTYRALYLRVTLGTGSGKSGTSTLTILGE